MAKTTKTRPTKTDLETELAEARKQLAVLRECHQNAEVDLNNAAKMLQAFMGRNDCGKRYLPESHDGLTVKDMLVAIAKGWFHTHPVSSADQISVGVRALLQAAHEEAWLYRAQSLEPDPGPESGDDDSDD